MDIRTLPDRERTLYNKYRKQYKLNFEKLVVSGKTVRILKGADIEEFLNGKDPFENISEFPFWLKLWESAMVLSYFLGKTPANGRSMLELGAGLGAPGLTAAAVGFDVTISDYEEIIMDFQHISAAASRLKINCQFIDWFSPPELPMFDILTGAEIVYREDFFEPLLAVFEKYLKPEGSIFLAHDSRRKSLPLFLEKASEYYDIGTMPQKINKDGEVITVLINRLKKK